jgi:hypothetical protein
VCRLHQAAFPCLACAAMNIEANRVRAAIETRLTPLREAEANRRAERLTRRDADDAYSARLVEKAKEDLRRLWANQ